MMVYVSVEYMSVWESFYSNAPSDGSPVFEKPDMRFLKVKTLVRIIRKPIFRTLNAKNRFFG